MNNPISKLEARYLARQDRRWMKKSGLTPPSKVKRTIRKFLRWLRKTEPEAPPQAPKNRAERRALYRMYWPREARVFNHWTRRPLTMPKPKHCWGCKTHPDQLTERVRGMMHRATGNHDR